MNLAQASQQQQRKSSEGRHIGKGLFFLFSVLAGMLAIWGGLTYYESRLSGEIDDVSARIAEERQGMSQDKIDAVADFQFRMDGIAVGQSASADPEKLLSSVESSVLPGILLSKYTFNSTSRKIEMTGEAESFRTVVQQMTVLKKLPEVGTLSVLSLKRDGKGLIEFSFVITLGQPV